MSQFIASRCYYCGLPVNPQKNDFCPRCHYPVTPAKEEAYLTSALASLQQAMFYGGAQLKVVELYQRYQNRLHMIQRPSASPLAPFGGPANSPASASPRVTPPVHQTYTPRKAEAVAPPVPAKPPEVAAPTRVPDFAAPAYYQQGERSAPHSAQPVQPAAAPPVPAKPPEPRRVFSWRSFFADQAINIIASLGAFLILVGALSFVATTSNLLWAFFIVFVVHAVFGITGTVTHRFAAFRIVANIYTVIFALLVPLVGFSAYRLAGGHELALSVPVLIAVSATYAAIVYIMLALFQRYPPFAYLGIAALAVADLATASALNLAYWWWPSTLMVLALISLVSIARSPRLSRIFDGHRAILRQPVRIFMYVFVVMGTLGMVALALYSVILDRVMIHSTEAGYALLCLSLLCLLWSAGGFYLARRTRGIITLAILFLVCVLAFCYALQFDATGYALALTIVALLYAGISRFAVQLLQAFGALELQLDWMALALVLPVPFLASPTLFLPVVQVFASTTAFQASWQTFAEVGAILAGIVLTLSIALKRASYEAAPRQSAWRWLLLSGAFLFTCAYSLVILALHLSPLWFFLGASVAFMVGAVLVRQYKDGAWADPLDVSALFTIILTLGLSLNASREMIGWLLLSFSASTYAILLYQRRASWLFVPTVFALLAIPALFNHLIVLVALGIAFPLAATGIRRFFTKQAVSPRTLDPIVQWLLNQLEWPLLVVGFVYAGTAGINDIVSSTSTIQQAISIRCPIGIELALFALSWYASAALARVKGWLIPALVFATGAILLPTNSFWVLVILTPALAILAVAARRFAGNAWSAPLAILALQAGMMTGITGFTQQHLEAATLALLAFALIAYVIGVIEDTVLPMWITPFFATWSVIVSAVFLNDPFRSPVVALVAAALGMAVSLYRRKYASTGRPRLTLSALPLYATACLAALLTGITGFTQQHLEATTIALLVFAIIAYVIGVIEEKTLPMWITPFFAIWSVIVSAGFLNDLFRPPVVALIAAALGMGVTLYRRKYASTGRSRLTLSALPLYATAFLAALLTGVYGSISKINVPFYGAVPDAILLYALVAFAATLVEKRAAWLWLTAVFAAWGAILALQLTPFYVLSIGAGAAAIGLIAGRVIPISPERVKIALPHQLKQFTWSWPWYATTLLAALLTAFWPQSNPVQSIIAYNMLGFTAIALAILFIERLPELLLFPAGFATGAIGLWYPRPDFTSLMIAYTGLCALVFATQFTWWVLPHTKGWLPATTLHEVLGIGGQALVVVVILSQGGPFASAGTLAQVGAGALLVLAALIFVYGLLRPHTVALSLSTHIDTSTRLRRIQLAKEVQHWCYYTAGLLLSLVVSWELLAFQVTRLDVLLLAPASYLTVISPFLMRDSVLRERRALGQAAAVLGACLLLLPALWFSFSDGNFLATAILLGESLALLILGMIARVRIFILSSAGLMIVGTLRALFLATPPSLTLMITGVTLLLIATVLILARHKLQIAWKQWE